MDLPAGEENLYPLFENIEKGSGNKLKEFLKESKYKYEIGINDLVYKPGLSIKELIDPKLFTGVFRLHVFQSISSYIRKFFKNERLIQLLEFPVLFLGSTPEKTPALYSLMNYADLSLGTWYPQGGMHKIIEGMESLAKSLGVKFKYNCSVNKLELNATKVKGIWSSEEFFSPDYVVGSADYHHIEQQLLPEKFRKYNKQYWDKRTMAPSSLLFYLGINKKIKGLLHHTLFFDEDFALHAHEIYEKPQWPTAPQFYVSCPSKTDDTVAPEGCENMLILIPVAAGLNDDETTREKYFDIVMKRLENILGESIREHILYKRSYAHKDFVNDYNAYQGNA
jgi:phytoene desaturase